VKDDRLTRGEKPASDCKPETEGAGNQGSKIHKPLELILSFPEFLLKSIFKRQIRKIRLD
jgi:hypothetical protein